MIVLWCASLLAADAQAIPAAPAAPAGSSGPASVAPAGEDEVLTARRRRRRRRPRRRRRRPKPKPKPAEPEPAAAPASAEGGADEDAIPLGPGGRTRVDFDAMQVKGQTTKAGEVQILERKDTELKSMVKRRKSFRKEIILSVFPEKAGSLD
jgi:hypothetical protein